MKNNTLEASFGIPGASTEPKNDLRVKPEVESKIGILFEFELNSSD